MIESTTEYPVSAAREHFADLVNAAAYRDEATYVTRHGKRIAVIVPVGEYEEMRERLQVPKRGTGAALKAMMAKHLEQFGPGDDSRAGDLEEASPILRARDRAVPIEDYSLDVALKHADLLTYTRLAGRQRGSHDLMIAATAAQMERILVTRDGKAAFDGLPGARVEFPKQVS